MTSVASHTDGELMEGYRASVGADGTSLDSQGHPVGVTPVVDELLRSGDAADVQQALTDTIEAMGPAGLQVARREVRNFVYSDGITYGSTAAGLQARNWQLDPLPVIIGAQEWATLNRGLQQRSQLLDLVLTDLYGPRRLLRERVIPAEAVLAQPGFIRQADAITLPGPHQLVMTACDLARDADGGWVVLSDKTQAPSGAGYAMANRRIITRVLARLHRQTSLARLRGFFHTMSDTLHDVAPASTDQPRAVLLSPGANSETAFDQAFLSTLLGVPLVEAEDLTSREGRIWLRGADRPQPVDVILRRVDGDWCDPLELRADSRLGLPGLIDAARRGRVSVLNHFGSGVVESPAVMAALPQACATLLGEDLLLPSAPTWWCGTATARQHVLANLQRLVLKPLARVPGRESIPGWSLDAAGRDELARRIEAEPGQWCGQEPVATSTAPTVTRSGLEARRLVLRTFGVARPEGYEIMPGGLARVAAQADQQVVSNMTGALAKDVWVLQPQLEQPTPRVSGGRAHRRLALTRLHQDVALVPRVSDNLFWLGRYAERAEATARLLAVADDLTEDYAGRPDTPGGAAMRALLAAVTEVTGVYPGFLGEGADQRLAAPLDTLRRLVIDADTPGTLGYAVSRLVQVSQQVRDQMSLDTWNVLSRLEATLADIEPTEAQLQPQLAKLLESLMAFAGIMAQGMVRDASWAFIDAGSHLERAMLTASVLRATLVHERSPVSDGQVTEAVLHAAVSIITHRRRASFGTGPAAPAESAVDLLVLDRTNPRALSYQLDRLVENFSFIGDEQLRSHAGRLSRELRGLDAEQLCANNRAELNTLLTGLHDELRALAHEITQRHFARKPSQRALLPSWETGAEPQEER